MATLVSSMLPHCRHFGSKSAPSSLHRSVSEVMMHFGLIDQIIVPSCIIGLLAALLQFFIIRRISLDPSKQELSTSLTGETPEKLVPEIYEKIMSGAIQFLKARMDGYG